MIREMWLIDCAKKNCLSRFRMTKNCLAPRSYLGRNLSKENRMFPSFSIQMLFEDKRKKISLRQKRPPSSIIPPRLIEILKIWFVRKSWLSLMSLFLRGRSSCQLCWLGRFYLKFLTSNSTQTKSKAKLIFALR